MMDTEKRNNDTRWKVKHQCFGQIRKMFEIWSPTIIVMQMFVAAADKKKKDDIVVNDLPLEENLNRMETENEARTVEEAISVLRYVRII